MIRGSAPMRAELRTLWNRHQRPHHVADRLRMRRLHHGTHALANVVVRRRMDAGQRKSKQLRHIGSHAGRILERLLFLLDEAIDARRGVRVGHAFTGQEIDGNRHEVVHQRDGDADAVGMVGDDGIDLGALSPQPVGQQEFVQTDVYAEQYRLEFHVLRAVDDAHVAVGIVKPLLVVVRLPPSGQGRVLRTPLRHLPLQRRLAAYVKRHAELD